jgi:hypothetical protein
MDRPALSPAQRKLVAVVAGGAVLLALVGFVGSYTAVRELAAQKGFGDFALAFPIGLDAGIVVLLCLDLLLAWLRMPFPLLRQTAWLLTGATIAFNAAAAWPDPLGVGMHAVIPLLFVVVVEAARHAVGRIADITADKHMEGVRLTRWLLSPVPTFKLWRRMKLWELRSYEQVIKLEQDRLIYQARLQARFGRSWRRKAPVGALMPLRLARVGVPLADTAPAGLAAAGIEPVAFEAAAAEALALAPPAAPEFVLDLAPMHPPIPELTAPVGALAASRARVEVHARIPDPNPADEPECVTPEVHPNPEPEPEAHPNPKRTQTSPAEFADLVRRARALSKTEPLTLRGVRAEFGIGQTKAQRVIAAATKGD